MVIAGFVGAERVVDPIKLQGGMEMWHQIRILIFLAIVGLVAGCKVAVIVVEGGEVKSISSGTCLEGEICMVQVIDTNFSDAFTAVPNPGWHFVKWNSGEGFFCGDSTNPTCTLSAVGFDGNEAIEAIIASDQTFHLMPIFEPGLATVTVDGREWAQVDQFTGLSWNDINAVCPEGACSGILNGFDMTGWKWASVDDVIALFNHYIGSDELRLGQYPLMYVDCIGVNRFFRDGWRAGLIADEFGNVFGIKASGIVIVPNHPETNYYADVKKLYDTEICSFEIHDFPQRFIDYELGWGGWFWRPL
jgi:hypothetical protein